VLAPTCADFCFLLPGLTAPRLDADAAAPIDDGVRDAADAEDEVRRESLDAEAATLVHETEMAIDADGCQVLRRVGALMRPIDHVVRRDVAAVAHGTRTAEAVSGVDVSVGDGRDLAAPLSEHGRGDIL
jgi:hypothetical protein